MNRIVPEFWLPILLGFYIAETFAESAWRRLRTGRWGPGPLTRALMAARREADP